MLEHELHFYMLSFGKNTGWLKNYLKTKVCHFNNKILKILNKDCESF